MKLRKRALCVCVLIVFLLFVGVLVALQLGSKPRMASFNSVSVYRMGESVCVSGYAGNIKSVPARYAVKRCGSVLKVTVYYKSFIFASDPSLNNFFFVREKDPERGITAVEIVASDGTLGYPLE